MVNHKRPGAYDFWVAPGGGVEHWEELRAAARREVLEETGVDIEPGALAYIEDLVNPVLRQCKFWFLARVLCGEPAVDPVLAAPENIAGVAWLEREVLSDKTVFPSVLQETFWQDLAAGVPGPKYLGLREMQFW